MLLKKDKKGCRTDHNNKKNMKFCSFCYCNGEFQNPEIDSASKMKVFVKGKLKTKVFQGFITRFFTRNIPNLEC